MLFKIKREAAGAEDLLNAEVELADGAIVLKAGNDQKPVNGKGGPVNPDYSVALRAILTRLRAAGIPVEAAEVVSTVAMKHPPEDRSIFDPTDSFRPPIEVAKAYGTRIAAVARQKDAKGPGNANKKIRLALPSGITRERLVEALHAVHTPKDTRSRSRLPVAELNKVSPKFIWEAIQQLKDGKTDHGFGPSTDFDVVADDGTRLPPKAVFGVAAQMALGSPIAPESFSSGVGSPCFKALEQAGFSVVPKGDPAQPPASLPAGATGEDHEFREGSKKLRTHLVTERAPGLRQAKLDDFRRKNGKLYCERCFLDPVKEFKTPNGEACIEVHHREVHVSMMTEGHRTKLDDLECLCANCHRLIHRALREATKIAKAEQAGLAA